MRKNVTEIVFILDRSGSMSGLEADTIGGFNAMLEQQKRSDGEALVSAVLFDDESRVLYDRVNIREIPRMTDRDYTVWGSTALLDAVGGAIHHIGVVHKCPCGGCSGAYPVYYRDRRQGKRQPILLRRPCKTNDRKAESRVRLGVSVPRREHRRGRNGAAGWDRRGTSRDVRLRQCRYKA